MPKFTLSKKIVLDRYDQVKELADIVSYSSKTNSIVTNILEKETDSFFSIHFKNELKHVKDRSRVVFLCQALDQKQLKELVDQGIKNFVVDNETDLEQIIKFLEKYDKKINLFLRIKLKEHTLRTERFFVFGMTSEIINKKIKELRKNTKIENLGIHFHRKTQNMSEWNLQYEISNILDKETIEAIDTICIGGGLPSEYANTNSNVFESIFSKIKEFRNYLKENKINLIIEPGRFIAAPAGRLITKIIGIHENTIIVDTSVYNTDMDAILVPVKLLIDGELDKGTPYTVKGITPCSMDLFRYRVYLDDPKIGDELIFKNAGAYNFSSDFCDLEKLETVIIE